MGIAKQAASLTICVAHMALAIEPKCGIARMIERELGSLKRLVGVSQFCRSILDPKFQLFMRLAQRLLGPLLRGDVLVGL